tara:strand:+ start:11393 stop:12334 length:942 start_codon:yes stop_codon:yes gene_type:complete
MDIFLVDFAYILTVGAPPKNMLPQQKVNHVVEKVMLLLGNKTCNKDIPIPLEGDLNLKLDVSGDCSCDPSADDSNTNTNVTQNLISNSNIDLRLINRENQTDNISNDILNDISNNKSKFNSLSNPTPVSKHNTHSNLLTDIKKNHVHVLLQYFAERDTVYSLTDECREMRKELYAQGKISKLKIINDDNPFQYSDEFLELQTITNAESSVSIKTLSGEISIIDQKGYFKINDILYCKKNNDTHFFSVSEIQNIDAAVELKPINWNIPISTQIYRHFYPNYFNTEKIDEIEKMILVEGIEKTIQNVTENYYDSL